MGLCRFPNFLHYSFTAPTFGINDGRTDIKSGPYKDGLASIDLIIENAYESDSEVEIKSLHGLSVSTTEYRGAKR